MRAPQVFDGKTRKRLAYLENAFDVSYSLKVNTLWTASFKLPYSDHKKAYCQSLNYVLLWDVDSNGVDIQVGLFRIQPQEENSIGSGLTVEYKLEHVLSTLLNDIMPGWHEKGGTGIYTNTVISYILSFQTEQKWVYDPGPYSYQYQYGWQEENLLSALFSVTAPFLDTDYIWTFDTTGYPWRLSLDRVGSTPVTDIRYRKNLLGLKRTEDPTNIVTRLYCWGYGQGDNRLGIADINGGLPYLESTSVSRYGVITEVYTDERVTVAETLKAKGQALLQKLENPVITYEQDVALYGGAPLWIGDPVRMVHEGFDEVMIVREYSKSDVSGSPMSGSIRFGQGTRDIGDSVSSVIEKQRIRDTYSQGSESIYADSLADNADQNTPLEISFTVPNTAVHVNEISLSVRLSAFRAYSKGIVNDGKVIDTDTGGGGDYTETEGIVLIDGDYTSSGVNPTEIGALTMSYDGQPIIFPGTPGHPIFESYENHTPGHVHTHAYRLHTHALPHKHKIDIPKHGHKITLPEHKHKINLPSHNHPIDYGIYLGPTASSMKVYLDGVLIGTYNTTSITDVNLIPSLSKDANGKVLRGKHTITIEPNNLTRIECAFQIRLFTNSLGGGQY